MGIFAGFLSRFVQISGVGALRFFSCFVNASGEGLGVLLKLEVKSWKMGEIWPDFCSK
jgi:hypothetical protein